MVATALLLVVGLGACAADPADNPVWNETGKPLTVRSDSGAVRILFAGDVILGRSVEGVVELDPEGVFADVRHVISDADLALLNLESPLTHREHESTNPNRFEADPGGAGLLADAGFDIAGLANNHSGDTGVEGIVDTLEALSAVGIRSVGVGSDRDAAYTPLLVDAGTTRIAILAFDLTWQGPAARADRPGLAEWESESIGTAIDDARALAEVVVVGLHGGVEYRTAGPDPVMDPALAVMAERGVDVVWGHGSHVVRPVSVVGGVEERATVAASSLGNFLFDQRSGAMASGAILEVLVDAHGVVAFRTGRTDHADLRVGFEGWDLPPGDAVAIDGDWWQLVRDIDPPPRRQASTVGFTYGDVFDAAVGDLTGDGRDEVVVSYRYPFRETLANEGREEYYADAEGRAAHFGIFEPNDWRKIWAAGTLQRPVEVLYPCGRVLGFGYSALDTPGVVATGAAVWIDHGFGYLADLEGPGDLQCGDIDGDGSPELIVRR